VKKQFRLKIQVEDRPVCDSVHDTFDDLEKTFEKVKNKVK